MENIKKQIINDYFLNSNDVYVTVNGINTEEFCCDKIKNEVSEELSTTSGSSTLMTSLDTVGTSALKSSCEYESSSLE